MKKIISLLTVAMLLVCALTGCGANKEAVATDGSTSMNKVIGALGEAFEEDTGITVTYNATGSGAGIQAVEEGRCDIGLSSRDLKDEEKANGLEGTILAFDGIAIIVNPDNPVNDLYVETIAKIYTGEIKNWKEVGVNDAEIVLIGREAGSGTRDGFEDLTGTKDKCDYRQELTSTGDVITTVASNPGAIGYASLASVKDTVKALSVDGVAPSEETIKDGNHSEYTEKRNGSEYEFTINSIESDGKVLGAVILVFDISDRAFAERNRQEFTANVTHELKTPLQSIIGSAELLENGLVKPEDTKRFVGNIKNEATRLVSLINDIIRLSQLDENHESATETVELKEVAKEVVEVLTASAAKRSIELSIEGDPQTIFGVRRYIYEIIYNLCDNAIRYNVDGGKVMIELGKDGGRAFITVKDTGIGIPAEHQSRIFERFYRVDKSHSKETGGTGLGLSIVKHAVAYHGGTIKLDSKVEEGTTITVTF